MYAWVTAVFTIFIVIILSWPKTQRDEQKSKAPITSEEIKYKKSLLGEFKKYRKHFLVYGFPIGSVLGITTHIPFIFALIKTPQEKFIDLSIQFGGVLFFLTFTLTMTLYRIYITIKHTEDHERRKGITDGILVSFFLIQVILFFFGYYEIFMPEISPFFHPNATKSPPS
jgi:hypothetical protein